MKKYQKEKKIYLSQIRDMEDLKCKHCGSVNKFNVVVSGNHLKAVCSVCDSYIKFLPQPTEDFIIPFGKYKDMPLKDMRSKEQISYLRWMIETGKFNSNIKRHVETHLKNL